MFQLTPIKDKKTNSVYSIVRMANPILLNAGFQITLSDASSDGTVRQNRREVLRM